MKHVVLLLAVFSLLSCSSPTERVNPETPSLTGEWDYTLTTSRGLAFGAFSFIESPDSVYGFMWAQTRRVPVGGAKSPEMQITIIGSEYVYDYRLVGTVNLSHNRISGELECWNNAYTPRLFLFKYMLVAKKLFGKRPSGEVAPI